LIACVAIPDLVTLIEGSDASSVILVDPAGKVQAATVGAIQAGVRLKMGARQSATLCSGVQLRTFDEKPYIQLTEAIEETLREFSTRIEPLPGFWQNKKTPGKAHPSAAMYYLDLGKLAAKDGLLLAEKIGELLLSEFGAPASIGLARSKFPAFVAARYSKPQYPTLIRPGEEGAYLASLPISLLPLGKELSHRLEAFGITTLGKLAVLPVGSVVMQLGKKGRFLHQLAQGNDTRPFVVSPKKPSYALSQQFDGAVEDRQVIENLLRQMGKDIERYLSAQGFTTQVLELTLLLENHKKHQVSNTLREPTANGRVIGRALIRLLTRSELDCGVDAVEVKAKDLAPIVWQQLDLFGTPTLEENRLSDLLDALSIRYGSEGLYQVQIMEADHPLPEYRFIIERVEAA
jgi:nucleotidyltransferase/DNA polymerase involved in DNA repair